MQNLIYKSNQFLLFFFFFNSKHSHILLEKLTLCPGRVRHLYISLILSYVMVKELEFILIKSYNKLGNDI